MPEPANVMNAFFLFFPPIEGDVGALHSLPSQSTHGSCGVLREAQRGAHTP